MLVLKLLHPSEISNTGTLSDAPRLTGDHVQDSPCVVCGCTSVWHHRSGLGRRKRRQMLTCTDGAALRVMKTSHSKADIRWFFPARLSFSYQISLDWPHTCYHTNTFFSPISDFTCVNKDISSMTTNHFLTIRQICFPRALHREIPKCTHVFPTILALYTFDDTHTPILTTRREAAGESTQKRIEFFFVSTKM